MNEEQTKLSRQLCSHPSFKWDLGMIAVFEDPTAKTLFLSHPSHIRSAQGRAYPDISDPSTVGVLLYSLTDSGIHKIVHQGLTKESFGLLVAKTKLEELTSL